MKKLLCLYCMFFAVLASYAAKTSSTVYSDTVAATNLSAHAVPVNKTSEALLVNTVNHLTVKDLSKALGRKLMLKEKIAWFFVKRKMMQGVELSERERHSANSNALLGFIFSLAGLFIFPLFVIPAFILSVSALRAEKANPGILTSENKGLATAGKIISIIDFFVLIIATIILIAILANLVYIF